MNSLRPDDLSVTQLIPHRPPALMLDTCLQVNEEIVVASVHIVPATPYYSSDIGGVPVWIGIEYMAQAVSLWSGHRQYLAGRPIRPGFLLGCKTYQCQTRHFQRDQLLTIEAIPCYVDNGNISSFNCKIYSKDDKLPASQNHGELAVSARINVVEPDDPYMLIKNGGIS